MVRRLHQAVQAILFSHAANIKSHEGRVIFQFRARRSKAEMVQVRPITNDVDLLRLNRRTPYRYVIEGLIRYDDQIRNPVRATLEKKQCLDQGTAALSKLCIEQFRAEIVLVIHKFLSKELE